VESHAIPGLKAILLEVSHALARLDADRLEEMARYCEALIGRETTLPAAGLGEADLGEPGREMATFGRVLQATRGNLQVMHRLRNMDAEQLEYSPAAEGCHRTAENEHGDD